MPYTINSGSGDINFTQYTYNAENQTFEGSSMSVKTLDKSYEVRPQATETENTNTAQAGTHVKVDYYKRVLDSSYNTDASNQDQELFGGTDGGALIRINDAEASDKSSYQGNLYSGNHYTESMDDYVEGVVFHIKSDINKITKAIFENNSAYSTVTDETTSDGKTSRVRGGAIYNDASITTINADFINNSVKAETANADGGAIYNAEHGVITTLAKSYFEGNSAKRGGAIYNNKKTIETIDTTIFIKNRAEGDSIINGGAIYNETSSTGNIGTINAHFIENTAIATAGTAQGGAIHNTANIGSINGVFYGNKAKGTSLSEGGAIYNRAKGDTIGTISEINGYFIENEAHGGGAIANTGKIEKINAYFENNKGTGLANTVAYGGAIYNGEGGSIEKINASFFGNTISAGTNGQAYGGAIANKGQLGTINKLDFINNSAATGGGAIYNSGTIGDEDGSIINTSFYNNKATAKDGHGGAIYTESDLHVVADNATSQFAGNTSGANTNEAIYVASKDATLKLETKNGGSFIFMDKINGETGYGLDIKGDNNENSIVHLNNDVQNADITHDGVVTNVYKASYIDNNNSLTMNGGTLNINYLNLDGVKFRDFNVNGGRINLGVVDVDLANKKMGTFTAKNYTGGDSGTIYVDQMNLLSDGKELITPVWFTDSELKDKVESPVTEAFSPVVEALGPVYRYDVSYSNDGKYGPDGYFVFQRYGSGSSTPPPSNPSDTFNPAVLSTPVNNMMTGYASMNETYRYVFEHADAFTTLPKSVRNAKLNANKYAISTDFNNNLGSLDYSYEGNKAGWFRGYAAFENVPLKNGPSLDSVTYGALMGYDTDFRYRKHGWKSIGTGYIGYIGSHVSYRGVDTNMNGGVLGLTETFYKGNFWSAITASVGAGVAQTSNMYGKENTTMLMAGIANRTGYNFEFKEGKYILQPMMTTSYTMVNTYDYNNAAGVAIDTDPLHVIQLHPSVRFISNLKEGWQPYAQAGVVWNVLNVSHTTANGIKLPEMGIKPYVEYGVGIQRNWKDKYTGYFQAMLRHGGRNGVALTTGFRWAIGRDATDTKDKVQNQPTKKIVKQLDTATKSALIKQNTTITANKAVIKSL